MSKYVIFVIFLIPISSFAANTSPSAINGMHSMLSVLSNDSLTENNKAKYIVEILSSSNEEAIASKIIKMYQKLNNKIDRNTIAAKECFVDKRNKLNEAKKEYMIKERAYLKREAELHRELQKQDEDHRRREEELRRKLWLSNPDNFKEKRVEE